jgi:hypothetical protein
MQNTYEVAQGVAPESRVAYVDNDPVVLAHARALLVSLDRGAGPVDYIGHLAAEDSTDTSAEVRNGGAAYDAVASTPQCVRGAHLRSTSDPGNRLRQRLLFGTMR